ncbi:hypothetical protein MMC22_009112 [Lobaria immixta]|nr:hypothetical protein [Lobaria immixta]
MQCFLDKYNSLGTKTKRAWDRLGWGSKDIAALRSRLISNTVLLTTFVNTSQIVVQRKLDLFLQESRDGKRESSRLSIQTDESLSWDERQAWRCIRKELEDIGISLAAFDANKDFIMNWFKTAISTGAFGEQAAGNGSSTILSEDGLSQPLEDERHGLNRSPHERPGSINQIIEEAMRRASREPRHGGLGSYSGEEPGSWAYSPFNAVFDETDEEEEDEDDIPKRVPVPSPPNAKSIYNKGVISRRGATDLEREQGWLHIPTVFG